MFYEGTEKRLLICTKDLNLLTINDHFWEQLVAQSGAEILSSIKNLTVSAYLLSESSLFIWQNKLLLITCGNTKLVNAALFIQQQFTKAQISTLLFQRHQPLKPQLQSSSFEHDSLLLETQFNGQKQHWRDDYQGDLFIFGEITTNNITTENIYMMHGLKGKLAEQLQQSLNKTYILEQLQLTQYFTDLSIDHFSFNPKGYSLNAITDKDYLTIHLTPEKMSTYLSIETSFSDARCRDLITHLQQLFLPDHYKRMHFQPQDLALSISLY
jgi:S-adenosylmethionine decarboxylase